MANKDLTTVRADQPADTPSNSTIIWCEKDGNTRGFTVDEISLLLQGATVQQGLQDAFRGVLLSFTGFGHSGGAIDWGQAEYDTDSFWSAASLTRITPPSDATKIRFAIGVHDISSGLEPPDSRIYLTRNGAASPEAGFIAEIINDRSDLSAVSAVITHNDGDYYELIKDDVGGMGATTWFSCEVVEQVQSP